MDKNMKEPGRTSSPLRFGFRRRCAWCGVVLRGWQLNLCRLCDPKAKNDLGGPPCPSRSRWDAEPDAWRKTTPATSPTNPEASRPKPSTLPVGPSGVSRKGSSSESAPARGASDG
jgi:hypothetical protein